MIDKSALRSTRRLFALIAFTAMLSTAACSSDSDATAETSDPPAADATTTTMVSMDDTDPATSEPTPTDDADEGDEDVADDDSSQSGSLPGDFPAIPLPAHDRVDHIDTGQMGSGKYSGRATFTNDAFVDKPLAEMIAAYGEVLVNAGFSPLELDDEGARIRGWSTAGDGELEVDITVYKDRPGELEVGGAHWDSIGL